MHKALAERDSPLHYVPRSRIRPMKVSDMNQAAGAGWGTLGAGERDGKAQGRRDRDRNLGIRYTKRVLVTGGGTGLGRAMAERLLALGATVEIWGRRAPVLEAAAREMAGPDPARVAWRAVDIRDAAAVEAAVAAAWEEGRPYTRHRPWPSEFISRTEDLSPRGFRAIADIVFHGTFQVTQAVGRRWIADRSGGAVLSIVVASGLDRLALRRALRHVEEAGGCHDQVARGGMGAAPPTIRISHSSPPA